MSVPMRNVLLSCLGALACSKNAQKLFEISTDGSTQVPMWASPTAVTVANEAGTLMRIGPEGGVLWRVPTPQPLASRPVEARGYVVATNIAGDWFGTAVSTGRVPWRLPQQPVTSGDLVTDGARVFAVLNDGSVRSIDPTSGAISWSRTPPPGAKGPSGSAAWVGTNVVVPLGEAGLWAAAWDDGRTAWRSPSVHGLGLAPTRDGSRVLVTTARGGLVAVAARSGEVLWRQQLGGEATTRPTVIDGRVYVGTGNSLRAFDVATGTPRETITVEEPVAPPARTSEVFILPTASREGRIHLFRPGELEPYDSLELDSPIRAAPVVMGGTVIFLATDGRVLGYRLKSPKR